jgi:hypothetical protein
VLISLQAPEWLILLSSLVEQLLLFLLATWLIILGVIVVVRAFKRQSLVGAVQASWEVAYPVGGLVAVIVVLRAVFAWSIQ